MSRSCLAAALVVALAAPTASAGELEHYGSIEGGSVDSAFNSLGSDTSTSSRTETSLGTTPTPGDLVDFVQFALLVIFAQTLGSALSSSL